MLRTAHGGSRMNKLSLNQLTQAHVDRLYNALYALADMVLQFGCETTFRRKKAVCDSGLSALESAFSALMFCGCKVNSNGRWEFLGPNRLIKSCMCGTCSVCHVRSVYIVNTAICPNCGAPMDKEDEHEAN